MQCDAQLPCRICNIINKSCFVQMEGTKNDECFSCTHFFAPSMVLSSFKYMTKQNSSDNVILYVNKTGKE